MPVYLAHAEQKPNLVITELPTFKVRLISDIIILITVFDICFENCIIALGSKTISDLMLSRALSIMDSLDKNFLT